MALLADMAPEELVELIDFRYLTDALTPEEALALLRQRRTGQAARRAELLERRLPVLHHVRRLARLRRRQAPASVPRRRSTQGFHHVKLKVGRDLADDIRRLRVAREVIGPDRN